MDIPAFLSSSEEYLCGHISANYSSGAPVSGNISVTAAATSVKKGMASYRTQPLLIRRSQVLTKLLEFCAENGNLIKWVIELIRYISDQLNVTSSFLKFKISKDMNR